MKKMVFALIASLSLLAVPTTSAAPGDVLQVLECDVTAGAAALAVWDNELGVGIGGCGLGYAEHTGDADIDQPRDCETQYDENDDSFADGVVEDEVQEGWFLVTFCDVGVVNAHITLKILEQ